jgi:CheY-like chemotaxis protein
MGSINPPSRALRGMRILAVDDQGDLRDVLVALLEQQGANVVGCASARQAFELLARGESFDAAVFDVTMPVEDGFTLVGRVRALEARELADRLPVVALTAHTAHDIRELCKAAGFDGYLPKPVVPKQLFETLRRLAHVN